MAANPSERSSTFPQDAEILFPPKKLELPISAEKLRFVSGGKGVDLSHRNDLNPYKDYEYLCFTRKSEEAAGKNEDCIFVGPGLTDVIFPKDEFTGIRVPDFFKLGSGLEELDEVKTAEEFMNEVRAKVDEKNGFPEFLRVIEPDFSRRIKSVLSTIYLKPSYLSVSPSEVLFRFLSPTSQEGRTTFQRWKTPHQMIIPTDELAANIAHSRIQNQAA